MGLDDCRLHHGWRRSRQSDGSGGVGSRLHPAPRERGHRGGWAAMSRIIGYRWNLRLRMAERGMFATTDLVPLLAERGVVLSREQVYRLVVGTPERLSLRIF